MSFSLTGRLFFLLAPTVLAASAAAQDVIGSFPDVQVPVENPLTPEKVRLGQALFFEEQLSSDDTMACATCHQPEAGGGDPRAGRRSPGVDGRMLTPDDEFGSPGMRLQDAQQDFTAHPAFGFGVQATARNSPTVLAAAFFNTQFWDTRALPTFRDLAGNVVILEYGSLETQAVEPVLSAAEMGHVGRTWDEVVAKLERVRPLDLALRVPPALEQFLDGTTSYAPLFRKAFGTGAITRERVAMAIASYERTLIPDQAPFDLGTMTPRQAFGFQVFRVRGTCVICHSPNDKLFTDGARRTISLPEHGRAVKTPTLRNVGLRKRYMSSGQFTSLDEVLAHYEGIGFIGFRNAFERVALIDFLQNALTDPRAAARSGPFERPTLRSEVSGTDARLFGAGTLGSLAHVPAMLADSPPVLGSRSFRIGLGEALGGTSAFLSIGPNATPSGTSFQGIPIYVEAAPSQALAFVTSGAGAGAGSVTYHADLPNDPALAGLEIFAQWFVLDPGAAGGVSSSRGAEFELFSRSFRPKARR
ncbi:MAG: hypothetical protein EXS08_15565 [Planctomycetes bacterium]|nr:hypothetical protein [Planctomycetota bacterium]